MDALERKSIFFFLMLWRHACAYLTSLTYAVALQLSDATMEMQLVGRVLVAAFLAFLIPVYRCIDRDDSDCHRSFCLIEKYGKFCFQKP